MTCGVMYGWIDFRSPFQIKKGGKLSASPAVMIDMPVLDSFIEWEWNTIVRS